jgi:arylsulfatase A-like enzyme
MKKPELFQLLGLFALLAAAFASRLTAAETNSNTTGALPRVLLIGDSICGGYEKKVKQLLAGRAEVVKNPGNAEHTATGLKKLDEWLGDGKWDVIHFNWGLWDIAYRNPESKNFGHLDKVDGKLTTSLPDYEQNLRTLVARLERTGARLIWASITPVPDGEPGRIKGDEVIYNAVAAKIMAENGVATDDLYTLAIPPLTKLQQPKNVHFTAAGYNLLAGQVADSILAALPGRKTATTQPKPNIVFFLADDLGYMDIGANNPRTFYETPNIDALAVKGMRFKQGYAACPVCSPTRASILTGKYPPRVGITDFIGAAQPEKWARPTKLLPAPYSEKLAHEEITLAEAFKAHGYATFFAGKWHLGPTNYWPEDQGFDINIGGIDRGGPYGGNKYFSPYGNPRLPDGPPGEHLPDRLATETAKFIEANRDRPFLAYLSFYSVHTPLMAREDLQKKYEAKAKTLPTNGPAWGQERERKVRLVQDHAVYAGMVEAMDQAVGKVLAALERAGLAERTVVVFMSDNGGLSTSEGHPTSNLPLRAGKGWLYEGGIREPMIIHAPGVTRAGSTCDTPVTSTDFYPTLLELAGLPPLPRQHVDGVSLVTLLKGESLARGPLFWHYPHYGNQGGSPGGAVRDGDWKLIEWYEGGLELFNLKDDLGEQHDLARENPAKVKELQPKLVAWRKEVGAKMPAPKPSAANPPAGQQQ